jgi:hypothetical protein
MSFKAAWHSWRIKVHDILEVGGETVCVVPGRPIKLLEGDFEMALSSGAVTSTMSSPTRPVASMCWTARVLRVSAAGTPRSSST